MVGLLTILTACQRQTPNEQENNDQSRSVKIPVYQFNGVSASARLQGTLQLKGECLYVDDTLIIFPEQSAHWDAQHQTLTYNDKKIALGEEIVIGGGNSQLESET
ncbi:hypothetical protein [Acinetobacter gyllenbergii]|uniref:hypothetical protein n=1 Tax=Acinetobacter gyllenbergii TaxID=134534 RepID=UPI003F55EFAF